MYSYSVSTSNLLAVSLDDVAILQIQVLWRVVRGNSGPVDQESQRFHRLTLSLAKSFHQSLHRSGFFDLEEDLGSPITDLQVDVGIVWLFFFRLFGH